MPLGDEWTRSPLLQRTLSGTVPSRKLQSCARDIPWGSDPASPVSLQARPPRLKTVRAKLCRPGEVPGQEVESGRSNGASSM